MKAILIKIDGTKTNKNISSFEEARRIVCNYSESPAQILTVDFNTVMLYDREGFVNDYPINEKATEMCRAIEAIYPHESIHGDVLVFENENEFYELPTE